MPDTKQIVLDTDGTWFLESIKRQEINPTEAMQRCFTQMVGIKARHLFNMEGFGPIHMYFNEEQGNASHWASIHLRSIHFRTAWKTIGEGDSAIMHPDPLKQDSRMSIEWNIEQAFQNFTDKSRPDIVLLINLMPYTATTWMAGGHYLFAIHPNKNMYRMPLSNLYDTCQVCMGDYNSAGETLYHSLEKTLHQFRTSQWNADLFKSASNLEHFVKVKPVKEGFVTLPTDGPWIDWCMKIGSPLSKYIL